MANVGNYYITIMPDMSKFANGVKSGMGSGGGILSGIGRILNTGLGVALGNALSSGWNAFMGTLDQGISRIDTINAFPRVMQNIGVSAGDASHAMDMLIEAVDGMPTTLDAAVAATQRFTLANGDVERSAQMFDALNNALLGGGQSAEAQAQALEQVSQAYAKGKPDYREWLSMQQNMGPALNMVAKAWGMTTEEMGEALKDGDRSMNEFFDTLIQLNEEGIDGFASLSDQADVSMQNIGTAVANVKNRFAQAWGAIIDEIGQGRIATALNKFSSSFRDAFKLQIAPAIGDIADAISLLFQPQEEFSIGSEFEDARNSLSEFGQLVYNVGDRIREVFGPLFEALPAEFSALVELFVDGFGNLDEFAQNFGETFNAAFGSIGAVFEAISPYVDSLVHSLGEFFEPIGQFVSGQGEPFAEMMQRIQGHLADLGPSADDFVNAFKLFAEQAGPAVTELLSILGSALVGLLPIFASIGAIALDVGAAIFAAFNWLINDAPPLVSSIISRIGTFFGNLVTKVTSHMSKMKQIAVSAFQGVVDFARNIPTMIANFFSGLGSRIGNAIGNIHFPTPHISWESTAIPGLSLPHISWYAQGGFVNGARLIGVGEAGTELIWPSYGSALDKYGKAIADHMGGAGTVYNTYLNDVRVNDDERIQRDVMQLLGDLQRYSSMNRG